MQLLEEGHVLDIEVLSPVSPYRTEHINRFGNDMINLDRLTEPLEQYLAAFCRQTRQFIRTGREQFQERCET